MQRTPATIYVGLRADEEEREGGDYHRVPDVTPRFPFRELGWGESDVMAFLDQRGVRVPERSDCAWCFFQTLGEWWTLWHEHRELYLEAEASRRSAGTRSARRSEIHGRLRSRTCAAGSSVARATAHQPAAGSVPGHAMPGVQDMTDDRPCASLAPPRASRVGAGTVQADGAGRARARAACRGGRCAALPAAVDAVFTSWIWPTPNPPSRARGKSAGIVCLVGQTWGSGGVAQWCCWNSRGAVAALSARHSGRCTRAWQPPAFRSLSCARCQRRWMRWLRRAFLFVAEIAA